ncbi:leucyl aminopeptidase [Tomitella fengzijianii]|uniref:Probable cytosol aminopeptidase n=1 Tax=Tomitella fengzijianii TaxID=2597660 RepID=A0A516X8B4_9ACTN|nr:leucyl aminopeptidase [Tomitella fengzijianii]QDQ99309.1 leucyl aminopeptidase [Tomitella fengzijianii]
MTAVDPAAEVLVVGLLQGEQGPSLADLGPLSGELAADVLARLESVGADGADGTVHRVPAPQELGVSSVLAVGLGGVSEPSVDTDDAATGEPEERLRQAAGTAARALTGVEHAVTTLSLRAAGPTAEGFVLGAYRYDEFKSEPGPAPVARVDLLVPDAAAESGDGADPVAQVEHAAAVAAAVVIARNFVNTPPSHLYPAEFADRARAVGTATGLDVEVLDEDDLAEGGYGGILGVGKGSSRPPRLVRMAHRGGTDGAPGVALVGKGVTFDSGGISIKPAAGMENMTSDMGGAAAVVATVVLAAQLGIPLDVTAYVPMAENLPSATAQRPGDVLTQYDGTTVEVINTDAEGRLILADAIARACEDSPAYLIDTATLTGAQMVALGSRTPGVMGTDDFRDRVARISRTVGENGWPMPLSGELRADLDSKVADLANVTNHRWGGMLVAGLFLREFVADGVQWAHLDVAGPAYNTGGAFGYTGKGGTGVPVRTMIAVLEDIAANG